MSTIVVIDSDSATRRLLRSWLAGTNHTVATAATASLGLEIISETLPDLVLLDLMLSDMPGLEALERVKRLAPRTPVIAIDAGTTSSIAIEAVKAGAFDYVPKPLDGNWVRKRVSQALRAGRSSEMPAGALPSPRRIEGQGVMVGRSPQILEVYKAIGRVAPYALNVLIRGESGTGKELIARAIHEHSGRAEAPFQAVNCAAIPDALLESELFGHERGSFTGADHQRIGKFEQCSGGTLFLDEVGDMTPLVQGKLLRVLQEQKFERVGGNQTVHTDVRIIAATHRDLLCESRFRADLYYRLNGYEISVPPLRERRGDIVLLLDSFLNRYGRQLGKEIKGIALDARKLLIRYHWPGNVREMQSVVKWAILHAEGEVVTAAALPEEVRSGSGPSRAPTAGARTLEHLVNERLQAGSTNLYAESLEKLEKLLLLRVLRMTGGNQSKAADILGISRRCLRKKVHSLSLQIRAQVCDGSEPRGSNLPRTAGQPGPSLDGDKDSPADLDRSATR